MKTKAITLILTAAACIVLLLTSVCLAAQTAGPAPVSKTFTFTFAPGNDLFTLRGNEAQLAQLFSAIDQHRDALTAGRIPIAVDGYCTSQPTRAENLRTAYLRASRVKSELITQKGLTEAAFVTGNYPQAYLSTHRDVVVVTLRIPAKDEPKPAEPVKEQPRQEEPAPADTVTPADPVILSEAKNPKPQSTEPEMLHSAQQDQGENTPLYRFALRTNLLYDALLLPTLGIEWRINPALGIRLDGSLSHWGSSTGKVQKIWMLNPEVRWYLLENRRFYVGASGTYGEYNLYGYPLGNLLKDDTGYQGTLWNAGLSVGYQLRLCRHLSADFNLGLGYTSSEYDSFTVTDGTRISKERNTSKNFWGPTQAGISLVWTISGKQ